MYRASISQHLIKCHFNNINTGMDNIFLSCKLVQIMYFIFIRIRKSSIPPGQFNFRDLLEKSLIIFNLMFINTNISSYNSSLDLIHNLLRIFYNFIFFIKILCSFTFHQCPHYIYLLLFVYLL